MSKSLIKQTPAAHELVKKLSSQYPVAFPLVFDYTELVWKALTARTEKESFEANMQFKDLIAEINNQMSIDAQETNFAIDFIYGSWYDSYLTSSFRDFRDRLKESVNNAYDKNSEYYCECAEFHFCAIMAIKKIRRDYLYHKSDLNMLCRNAVAYFELLKENVEEGLGPGDLDTVYAFLNGYVEKNNPYAILAYSQIAFDDLIIPILKQDSTGELLLEKKLCDITDEEKEKFDGGIVELWELFEYNRQTLFDEETACQKLFENRLVDEFFANNKYPWRKTLSILKRIESIADNRWSK